MTQTTTKDYLYKKKISPIAIPLTNDYQFRALMQMNEKVLRGLIGALLHLKQKDIISVEIKNPIELGTYIDDKDFILDLKVLLNGSIIVNLELQVINEHNWPERSMVYLCRAFDNLNRGENYYDIRPAIQIGLLDFSIVKDHPEFYSSHMLMNVKTHRIYSDKLKLNILELRQSALATKEDKQWKIDEWARFFKAKTWEEIKMLAQSLPVLNDAAETIYHISLDQRIREQCEAREEFYRRQRTTEIVMSERLKKISEQEKKISEQEKKISTQQKEISEQEQELADQKKEISDQKKELTAQRTLIAEKDQELEKLKSLIISMGGDPGKF